MSHEALAGAETQPAPAKLDDLMMAMDVVDTLRHRERLIERELNEEVREEQLIARLRALYKSQGLDVPDSVIAQGVKALKDSRFVYTPPKPSFERSLARVWVKHAAIGKWLGVSLGILALAAGTYHFSVVRPQNQRLEAARIELTQTLPRELGAAHQAILASSQVPATSQKADALLAEGRAALDRRNAAGRGPRLPAWTSFRIRFARNIRSGSPDGPRIRPASSAKIRAIRGVPTLLWSVQLMPRATRLRYPSGTTRPIRRRRSPDSQFVFRSKRSKPSGTTNQKTASCKTYAWQRSAEASLRRNI